MRRKDKEIVNKNDIESIFIQAEVCRLGLMDGKLPYIVPMNFGYANNTLYFHSASKGKKIDLLKKNSDVFFEIDIPGNIITSEKACSWSMSYMSVMGYGKVVFITRTDEKLKALNIIMKHYSKRDKWDFSKKMLESVAVFKINIDSVSAKNSGND